MLSNQNNVESERRTIINRNERILTSLIYYLSLWLTQDASRDYKALQS
jgi:hypothetical protein